jgi:hypothetical protein
MFLEPFEEVVESTQECYPIMDLVVRRSDQMGIEQKQQSIGNGYSIAEPNSTRNKQVQYSKFKFLISLLLHFN